MGLKFLIAVLCLFASSLAVPEEAPIKGAAYRILIEAKEEHSDALAMFEVGDLLHSYVADPDLAQILATDPDSLIEIISWSVAPESWRRVHGSGEIFILGDALVVRQNHEGLKMVAGFLAVLRKARDVSARSQWGAPAVASIGVGDEEGAAARAALRTPIDLQMIERLRSEIPLRETTALVAAKAGIRIDVDVKSLEEAGLGDDIPVTLPLRSGSLEAILFHMLLPVEMTYEVQGEAIFITTPECSMETTRLFPAIDLICSEAVASGDRSPDHDSIIELVNSVIEPDSWHEGNHPGSGDGLLGAVAFLQTDNVHITIECLFAALRLAKQRIDAKSADASAPIFLESEDDRVMRKCLAQRADFAFDGMPALEVARMLTDKYGLPFLVDERGFEDAGVPLDLPLTGAAKGGPLGDALRRLLSPHELAIVVRCGVAFITIVEREFESHVVAVYPVHDLASPHADDPLDKRLTELEEIVRTVGGGKAWEREGGPGSVQSLHNPCVLVVRHTEVIHAEVAAIFANLRSR